MSEDFNGSQFIILFVDTGDICRSPMARGYLYKLLKSKDISHISIKTCGVMTPTGLHPTPETVQLLGEDNIDIRNHRSKPLTSQMLDEADLVLGMTPFHVQTAIRKNKACEEKTHLLKEYISGQTETPKRRSEEDINKEVIIHDPMGGTIDIYRKAFKEIKDALSNLVLMDIITTPPPAKKKVIETPFQSQVLIDALEKEKLDEMKQKEEKLLAKKARNEQLVSILSRPGHTQIVKEEAPKKPKTTLSKTKSKKAPKNEHEEKKVAQAKTKPAALKEKKKTVALKKVAAASTKKLASATKKTETKKKVVKTSATTKAAKPTLAKAKAIGKAPAKKSVALKTKIAPKTASKKSPTKAVAPKAKKTAKVAKVAKPVKAIAVNKKAKSKNSK